MNLLDLIISPAYAAEGINADPSALSQLIPLVLSSSDLLVSGFFHLNCKRRA
jgi:hypothetical protein